MGAEKLKVGHSGNSKMKQKLTKPLMKINEVVSDAFAITENDLFDEYHIDYAHNGLDEYVYFDDDVNQVTVMDARKRNTYGHSSFGVQGIYYGQSEMYDTLVLGSVVLLVVSMLACCTCFIIVGYVAWKRMRITEKKRDFHPLERDASV